MRVLSKIKNLCVPAARRPRKILSGPFKQIEMFLSLQEQTQVFLGLFEREVYPWLWKLANGVATAIDIGAAHGEYSLFFLKKTAARKVWLFEPDSAMMECLRQNLQLNGFGNSPRIVLSKKLVGPSINERQINLDSLEPQIEFPCTIKMDVDGYEEEILKGAQTLNSRRGVNWLIETHSAELEDVCLRTLTSQGFHVAVIRNAWWRVFVPEQRPIAHNRWLAAWKDGSTRQDRPAPH